MRGSMSLYVTLLSVWKWWESILLNKKSVIMASTQTLQFGFQLQWRMVHNSMVVYGRRLKWQGSISAQLLYWRISQLSIHSIQRPDSYFFKVVNPTLFQWLDVLWIQEILTASRRTGPKIYLWASVVICEIFVLSKMWDRYSHQNWYHRYNKNKTKLESDRLVGRCLGGSCVFTWTLHWLSLYCTACRTVLMTYLR